DVSTLWPEVKRATETGKRASRKTKAERHQRRRRSQIGRLENRAIPGSREDQLVHRICRERMRLVQLPFVLWLVALRVERGINGVGECRLQAMVRAEMREQTIAVADVLVDAAGQEPLVGLIRRSGTEDGRTGDGSTEAARSGEPAATTRRIGRRDGAIRSGSSCPKVKHVLIEGQLARRCCCNVRQSSCLELRRRNAYLGVGGQDHSQTFCVDEE